MSIRSSIQTLSLLLLCLHSISSAAEEEGLIIGLTTETEYNLYRGQDGETDILPFIKYEGEHFYIEGLEAGYRFINSDELAFGLHLQINNEGYEPEESDFFIGMEEPEAAWEAGIALSTELNDFELSFTALTDVSDNHEGSLIALAVAYEFDIGPEWELETQLALLSHDEDFNQYYYGVTAADALPNRPIYSPDSSTDIGIEFELSHQTQGNWYWQFEIEFMLHDDTIEDSPLTEEGTAYEFEISLGYAY